MTRHPAWVNSTAARSTRRARAEISFVVAKSTSDDRSRWSRRRSMLSRGDPARDERRARTSTPTRTPSASMHARSSSPNGHRQRRARTRQPCAARWSATASSAATPNRCRGSPNGDFSCGRRGVVSHRLGGGRDGQSPASSSSSRSGRSSNTRSSGSCVPASSIRIGAKDLRCHSHGPSSMRAS